MVGGRNYGLSQLDHAVAKRQPGSSFKPFVYTAAMMTALDESSRTILTPASTVHDEPTTFWFDEKPYEPANHKDEYHGVVTLREALAHSLNIPAVKVAEMVGYDKVAQVARAVGLNIDIQPTPSIALGAYEVTPLEIAGAYTVFPNLGDLLKTTFLKGIRDQQGGKVYEFQQEKTQAIDPRVAYLVENMMEEVLRWVPESACTATVSTSLRQVRRGPPGTAGSPASPPSLFALFGWASTITTISSWRARTVHCPSGPSS